MPSQPVPLRIIAFPGAPNLPTFAALAKGFFEAENLAVELTLTPSSVAQAERTAAGEFDVVFTAFDNVVAYGEGQGAAPVDPEYAAIMGATQLELSVVAQPEIKSFAELRGRTVALDALSTGFAFVLYEMLARAGVDPADIRFVAVGATPQRWQSVKGGEHAATLTIEPFTSIAQKAGFNVLGRSTDIFEAYQGGSIAVRRSWADANRQTVLAFVRAYRKGLDWVLDPANRQEATSILRERMPEIQPGAVDAVMNSLLSPRSGLTPDGVLLPDGIRQVLALRSRYGKGGGTLGDPGKYLDPSYLKAATDD